MPGSFFHPGAIGNGAMLRQKKTTIGRARQMGTDPWLSPTQLGPRPLLKWLYEALKALKDLIGLYGPYRALKNLIVSLRSL